MKVKCPKCGHEFDSFDSAAYFDSELKLFLTPIKTPEEMAKEEYPDKKIPPYPYQATGYCMPYLIACQKCGKLKWSLEAYERVTGYICNECRKKDSSG